MTAGMVSLYALAALLGVAPTVLRATLGRAGIRLSPNSQASRVGSCEGIWTGGRARVHPAGEGSGRASPGTGLVRDKNR